jgi:hypothetical protein
VYHNATVVIKEPVSLIAEIGQTQRTNTPNNSLGKVDAADKDPFLTASKARLFNWSNFDDKRA